MVPHSRPLTAILTACASVVACSGATTTPPPPKKAPAPEASVVFPETAVPAGRESTQCVVLRLGNEKPAHIGSIRNALGDGSHHLIVYRVADTVEQRTPFSCKPFADTLDPERGSPLMITQKKEDTLTLPPGVAFSIDANQMLRLEMHYINASPVPRIVTAKSTLVPISDDDFKDEASFLFIGNPDINIPPKSQAKLGPTFFVVPEELAGVKYFAMTGHEHELGTNVQVAAATSANDPGRMVYDVPNWSWSEPKTEVFSEPFTLPNGGGFRFTCTWNNTTDHTVRFGESANAEMCFFWAYYYPSQGARVCMHTARLNAPAGKDMCCPGDALCGFAKSLGSPK